MISSHTCPGPKDFGVVEALADHYRKRQGNFEFVAVLSIFKGGVI
jgi:hypothetical protein